MRKKSVYNYYMNLNGFAYDPFKNNGSYYIRVANLKNENSCAIFCVVNSNVSLVSSSMGVDDMAQVQKDICRNAMLILGGLT